MNRQVKYFSILFSLVVIYLTYILLRPFIGIFFPSMILAYLLYPAYTKINSVIKNETLSMIILMMLFLFFFLLPLFLVFYSLADDISRLYSYLMNTDFTSIEILDNPYLAPYKNSIMKSFEGMVIDLLRMFSYLVRSIPEKIVNIVIFIIFTSFFIKNGFKIVNIVKTILPLEKMQKDTLISEFESVTKTLFYTILFVMIYDGILATIGMLFLGVPNPLLWGSLVSLFSIVPFVGNTPVWIGVTIYLILTSQYLSAIVFFGFMIAVSNTDHLVAAKVIGDKTRINPLLIFLGLIGGIQAFGFFMGIFFGPLTLSLFFTIVKFYTKNYKKEFNFAK